ncbi:FtsW/RodA/SpoVE family cell cycle protein [Weissella ceti]|uniref:Probable peptidoglycan glycosyltransferase FtsW n=1 Tax=Weissella ceti TaxID=759620 RepID=A0ABT3E3B0_9LACO|nr:FtsW/RodA/SpoVE family cell cycle protein [Weissella ceti]MCW0952872.1 FtsW/RodA/SpoVE family cell cycle protein [Weissella ceti]QVK12567.1 FtsW/RodA/SpoVE family cell cycle protein [Weissella ceti]
MKKRKRQKKAKKPINFGHTIRNWQQRFKFFDGWLFLGIVIVMMFGCAMVYTASTNMATGSALNFFIKQAVFGVIAVIALITIYLFPINWESEQYRFFVNALTILLIFVLFITLMFGPVTSGAKGWLYFMGFGFQPVEYFKIALILYLSWRFSKTVRNYKAIPGGKTLRAKLWSVQNLTFPVAGMGLTALMPDLGGTVILGLIFLMISFTAGVGVGYLLTLVLLIIGTLLIMPILLPLLEQYGFLQTYQLARFEAYIDPWSVGDGAGHQLINSYYALSNGGFFGRGLGNSIQKLGLLPEPNTDFILAIIGEELGAIAVCALLIFMGVITLRLMWYGINTRNLHYRLILFGIAAYIIIQIFINLGGVTGLLPITGVTFPLISYGGSSLLSWGLTFGLAFNIIGKLRQEAYERGE